MEEAQKSVTPASFVCKKCKGTPSMDQILQSVATYGLIWLSFKQNTWLGFNCPLCEKPWINIKKFKGVDIVPLLFTIEAPRRRAVGESSPDIIASVFNLLANHAASSGECARVSVQNTDGYGLGDLVYHSFPFSVNHPVEGEVMSPCMRDLDLTVYRIGKETVYLDEPENPDYRRKLYSSYRFGYDALGPAIAIWWYKDEDIEKLASFESESGLRAFPRYRVYKHIYKEIDILCWEKRLQIDYSKEKDLEELEGASGWTLKQMLSDFPKRELENTFFFMHILDMPHLEDIQGSSPNNIAEYSSPGYQGLLKKAVEIISDLSRAGNLDRDRERIRRKVWSNFTKDYVQDLLKKLSEKFIDEYIALSKRVDFSYKAVWELKEKYLSDLVKAIKSPLERQKLEQKGNEYHRLRVLEAEKCFPGVKIISQDFKIDEWKIYISKLSKVPTDRKSFLLLGNLGTGKGLFAKAIHEASGRKGELVTFNCPEKGEEVFKSELFGHEKGSYTGADKEHEGFLEKAQNGTIFIDEIGDLHISLQPAMLRFLQDWEFNPMGSTKTKKLNAMVILATNKDLKAEIEKGNFRKDLHSRINSNIFKIPPLNSRKDDIPLLLQHFIKHYDYKRANDPTLEEFTATPACIKALIDFDWDEDVRQLEKLVDNLITNKNMNDDRSPIDVNDLQELFSSSSKSKDQAIPKSNEPSHPIERRYFHLPEDSVLIELKKQGMKNREIAEKFKVAPETVSRRFSKIAKSQN